jgi:hypothetical protein
MLTGKKCIDSSRLWKMTEQENENLLSESTNFDEHLNLWLKSSMKSMKISFQLIMMKPQYLRNIKE